MQITPEQTHDDRELVTAALRTVLDPELGIDVLDLGLVYDIRVGDRVEIDMTLTTPGCPVAEQLPAEVGIAVRAAVAGRDVVVRVVWDPPWTPERIATPEGAPVGIRRRRR